LRRSTVSDTGFRLKKVFSLRFKLFFAILGVTLACVVFFALLSNYLVHRQFEQTFEGIRVMVDEPQPPPPPHSEMISFKEERLDVVNLSYIITGLLGILLAFVLSWYISNRVSKPLAELTSATGSITDGEYGKQVTVKGGSEVEELGEAFNALSQSLERNEVLRKNMIADISHELRNPLAAQRGHLEALEDGVIDLDEDVISILMKNNLLLSRLVEDLRQLSLVDAGQVELELMPVDAHEALRVAASNFEHDLTEKEISLVMEIPTNLPALRADRGRISQVLANLLTNALLYTPAGGQITLDAKEVEEEVVISVSDTGPGIEQEELTFIFDRFHRTDRSRTRDTGGTGLGLSIAKGLVEAHGGRMWAESEIGQGTSIFFTLPVFPREHA